MFEDFVKNNAMEDEIKPSKKRIKANCSALRSLIEQEENMNNNAKPGKIFKKPFAIAAAIAICVCLTGVTAFAASNGLFSSIKKAFYNDGNTLRASEPSEYAFIPEAEPIIGDGVTVNVTEAIADSHEIMVFMDMIFENGIPQDVLDNVENGSIGFEKYYITQTDSFIDAAGFSAEDNVLSFYITIGGIQENEWENNGITIEVENLTAGSACPGKIIYDISGNVTIPPEQIKRNHSVTAYSKHDGIGIEMELSLLGINMVFDSTEEFIKTENKIANGNGIITGADFCIYCKDNTVYRGSRESGKPGEYRTINILTGDSAGPLPDGKFYHYTVFNMPVDIENIEKITLGDYEFCFE